MDYPDHIYDSIRQKIAIDYINHEFKKLFLKVPEKDFVYISQSIEGWKNSPELATPRDFWNGLHGISMGFKLKTGLIYLVTAENIKWKKERVDTKNLYFGVELKLTKIIRPGKLSAVEVLKYYEKNPKNKEQMLVEINKIRRGTIERDSDPILVIEKNEDGRKILSVYDGNGRLGSAILKNINRLDAYVGRFTTEVNIPINYWLPTSLMVDILYYSYRSIEDGDELKFKSYIAILKDMLSKSQSGQYEFYNRALASKEELRRKIIAAMK